MAQLSFEIEADYSKLTQMREEIDKTRNELRNMDTGASPKDIQALEAKLKALTSEYQKFASTAGQAGREYRDEFVKNVEETGRQIVETYKKNNDAIHQLEEERKQLGTASGVAHGQANDDEYRQIMQRIDAIGREIAMRQNVNAELMETGRELDAVKRATSGATAEADTGTNTMRQRIRELQMEMANLRKNGISETSEEYRKLADELGDLMDIRGDIARQGSILSNDQKHFAGVISGIQGITGAYTAAQGAISLFAGKNEDLQRVMMKVQALMSITMGLQQISNTLNKDSAFMLVTVRTLKEAWVKTEKHLTTALWGSTAAARAFMATVTLGLSVAIAGIIYLIDKYTKKQEEAAKKAEEAAKRAKAAQKLYQDMYKETASTAANLVSTYEQLRDEYSKLKTAAEKQQWIKENANKFDELSISVGNVSDADKFFINNTDNVIAALELRAKHLAILSMQTKAYEQYYQQQLQDSNTIAGGGYRRVVKAGDKIGYFGKDAKAAGLTDNDYGRTNGYVNNEITESGAAKLNAYYAKEAAQRRAESKKQREEELKKAQDFARQQIKDIEEEQKKLGIITNNPRNGNRWNNKGAGGRDRTTNRTGKNTTKSNADKEKAERERLEAEKARYEATIQQAEHERAKLRADQALEDKEHEISLMQDGWKKEKAQLELQKKQREKAFKEEVEQWVEEERERRQLKWEQENPNKTEAEKIRHKTAMSNENDKENFVGFDQLDSDLKQIYEKNIAYSNALYDRQIDEFNQRTLEKLLNFNPILC